MPRRDVTCPMCEKRFAVDNAALLRGEKLACDGCGTSLAVEPGQSVRDAIARFEQARAEIRNRARD